MGEQRAAADELRLEVPTTPDLLRLVRVAASGVASRLGFSFDAVEDVRLAVDELCWSVAGAAGPASTLTVRFTLHEGSFTIDGELSPADALVRPLPALSERILGTLVDAWSFRPAEDGHGPGFTMTTKRT